MMIMTAKVDMKKILTVTGIIAAILSAVIWLFGGSQDVETVSPALSTNDGRVKFLSDFGWDVSASPVESSQVRIPEKTSEVFDRYNTLQKSQGYDLSEYAGKNVMRYVYQIRNYPGATEPVYATLLLYKNKIIGGDVTDTSAKGQIRPFRMPSGTAPTETAIPSDTAQTAE